MYKYHFRLNDKLQFFTERFFILPETQTAKKRCARDEEGEGWGSTRASEAGLGEVGGIELGTELIIGPSHNGAFTGEMIDHCHRARLPVTIQILRVVAHGESLQVFILAVEVIHFQDAKLVLVAPDELASVARFIIDGDAFGDRACQLAVRLVAQVAVGELLHLRGAHVLIGKFAAHEGTGTIRGTDALDPFQGGQIEPLVVRPFPVGVDEKCGPLDVAWMIEHEHAHVGVAVNLQNLYAQFALALLPLPVAQHHGLASRKIAKTLCMIACFNRDFQPGFLGSGVV